MQAKHFIGPREQISFPFPVPVTKAAGKAIDDFFNVTIGLVYPFQLGFSLEKDKVKWLEIMFRDKPSYDCSLALIQASNEIYLGIGYNCTNSLSCISQTLEQLKVRLNSKDALSDHTLSIVMALINQEQAAEHYTAAETHMLGLKKIVDLRGGLEKIQNGIVAVKICRTDILFALQQGGSPLFYRDHMDYIHKVLTKRGFLLERDSGLYSHMNEKPLNLLEFQEVLVSICYRLLKFQTINKSRLQRDIQSAYHIGLSLFMTSIYFHNKQHRMVRPGLIAALVKEVVEGMLDEHEHEFALWLLLLGGISVSVNDGRDWMVKSLRERASMLGIVTWEEAKGNLVRLPWMDAIHDEPSLKIWDEARLADIKSLQRR
ncbi:hypothetical protein FBEOM_9603 [Fusarium beomiforme]|uniref:Uncharacterized protein n=1 Tax=Fusarium beomiforme TaxID=44412 RepID=A0A9P5DT65_9HYPO|nr:hypothetical protein FBEOM_9603 [Fusarium beomiforme]